MPPAEVEPAAVVVIGGGFAGLNSALQLAAAPNPTPVVLLEPQERFLFLPLLYELLSGEMRRWEIAPRYQQLLAGSGVVWLQERATRINTARKTVETSSGRELPYKALVVATGGRAETYGIPGVLEHALSFRSLEDVERLQAVVQRLRERQRPLQRLVVVGAGASGVELSCKLADLLEGAAIVEVIEQGADLLPGSKAFNRDQARQALLKRDIRLRTNTSVTAVQAESLTLQRAGADAQQREALSCDAVIWTGGLAGRVPDLNPPLPLDPRGRLICNSCLQVIGADDLYALGDAAACPFRDADQASHPATAQVAYQQASCISSNLKHQAHGESLQAFNWNDLGEMLGLGIGQASITGMGLTLAGAPAFQLRRLAYMARMPGLQQQLRVAGGWLATWL